MTTIRLPNGWRPRGYQKGAWGYFERGGKRGVSVAHRRWGKDDVALHLTAVKVFERRATYWHMLPQAKQARKAIWQAINPHTGNRRIDEAFPQELRKRTNDNEMFIEFLNGSMWHVVGSDNYDSLVGSPPAGIVLSEWALANPAAWAYLEPILNENGGWAFFIYTSRGKNHGWNTYEYARNAGGWFAQLQTADDTGVFTEAQLAGARQNLVAIYGPDHGEALFQQEYYCSFDSAVLWAYYGHQLSEAERQGRICAVPYDPAAPVYTAWDLGIGDSTSIWFIQPVGQEHHWIDYYEASGMPLDHYVKVLKDKPYAYEEHLLPHDGDARELGTGKSRREMLEAHNLKIRIVPRHNVDDGINETRNLIQRSWFDKEKTEQGLSALRSYRAEYDEKKRMLQPRPVHDWASHGADAARTFAMGFERPSEIQLPPAASW